MFSFVALHILQTNVQFSSFESCNDYLEKIFLVDVQPCSYKMLRTTITTIDFLSIYFDSSKAYLETFFLLISCISF